MPNSIGYSRAASAGRPGTTDPNYLRRQALSQQLIGQSLQARPAYSWGEALARALTPVAQTWGAKDDQNTAQARDKSFQTDYGAAVKQWSEAGADPQALSQILAGHSNPDIAAEAPGQIIQDAAWKRDQAMRNEDRTWRTVESDKDRAIRQQQHEDQMALSRQAAARAGAGSFGQPQVMMVGGKPTVVQFNSRGGYRVVEGIDAPAEATAPPFAGSGIEAQRENIIVGYEKKKRDNLPTTPDEDELYKRAKNVADSPRANQFRDEYTRLTGDFRTVQDAYSKIREAAKEPSGAGDMSLLYSYVKILDPGSVVRESEFATAAASGSFGERIQGLVNRVINGERLPDSLRRDFVGQAEKIYKSQKGTYDKTRETYGDLAKKSGIDPSTAIPDFYRPELAEPMPMPVIPQTPTFQGSAPAEMPQGGMRDQLRKKYNLD